jgi:hypothetical protein
MTSPVTIDEIPIPDSLESHGADDFRAAIAVRNAAGSYVFGQAAATNTPEEMLPALQEQRYDRKLPLVARKDGQIVGIALLVGRSSPTPVSPGSKRPCIRTGATRGSAPPCSTMSRPSPGRAGDR